MSAVAESAAVGGIAESLLAARARLLSVYADLPEAYWDCARFPYAETVNPPLWELAHVAWFQEYWCRRYDAASDKPVRPSMLERADALFDSRYVPHLQRWTATYPEKAIIDEYLARTLDAALGSLQEGGEASFYFQRLALHHEQMHAEALLMTRLTLELPLGDRQVPPLPTDSATDCLIRAGRYQIGAAPDCPHFLFDNEKYAHPVALESFSISSQPVSNAEFAQFVCKRTVCTACQEKCETARIVSTKLLSGHYLYDEQAQAPTALRS